MLKYQDSMEDEQFKTYIEKAVALLPEEFRRKMDNVAIFIQEFAKSEELIRLGPSTSPYHLLGLYQGIAQTRRGHYGVSETLPDRITIFKQPILMRARSEAHLIELIRNTVWHEIGHHFGMNEEEIREAEKVRGLASILSDTWKA